MCKCILQISSLDTRKITKKSRLGCLLRRKITELFDKNSFFYTYEDEIIVDYAIDVYEEFLVMFGTN